MTATADFEKHRDMTIVHDLRRLLFKPSTSRVDFTLLDLAQKTMDGFKDGVGGPSVSKQRSFNDAKYGYRRICTNMGFSTIDQSNRSPLCFIA
jgi:hypothetical protein